MCVGRVCDLRGKGGSQTGDGTCMCSLCAQLMKGPQSQNVLFFLSSSLLDMYTSVDLISS